MFHLKVVHGSQVSQDGVRNNEVTKFSEENSFLEIARFSPQVRMTQTRFFSLYLSVRESSISFQICMQVMASFPSRASRVV